MKTKITTKKRSKRWNIDNERKKSNPLIRQYIYATITIWECNTNITLSKLIGLIQAEVIKNSYLNKHEKYEILKYLELASTTGNVNNEYSKKYGL